MHEVGPFVTLSSSQERAIVEHILSHWVEGPEVSLSGVARFARDFDEAIVEGEIVTD